MEPMTDQEKNGVLAKFAGFTHWDDDDPKNPSRSGRVGWYLPDAGTLASAVPLPDFLHSLDALFKWVMPEAIKRYGTAKVYIALRDWAFRVMVTTEAPSPEACAEAILSLISA